MLVADKKSYVAGTEKELPGRDRAVAVPERHFVNGNPLQAPFPEGMQQVVFGMGCFWGAERLFWNQPGVYTTAAGYSGGTTKNPDYREVCSGQTGHSEVELVVYDPRQVSFETLLKLFWESHDPTQGMRQGNDVGSQYRSLIYTSTEQQLTAAMESRANYERQLQSSGFGPITTEIAAMEPFYYAEDYHQQYLAKNPDGYCGIGGTGVSCPIGIGVSQTSAA